MTLFCSNSDIMWYACSPAIWASTLLGHGQCGMQLTATRTERTDRTFWDDRLCILIKLLMCSIPKPTTYTAQFWANSSPNPNTNCAIINRKRHYVVHFSRMEEVFSLCQLQTFVYLSTVIAGWRGHWVMVIVLFGSYFLGSWLLNSLPYPAVQQISGHTGPYKTHNDITAT